MRLHGLHGNPTFLFSVKGKDLYGKEHTYQCYLTFTKTQVEKTTDADGYTEQSVQIPGNSGRKRLPGTGEEGAAVFAYAGDRYEECYREKTRRAGIWKDPARVFSVSVNLCGHPKESEVVFENQKYRWDDYGHNSIVKNRIPVE